LLDVLLDALLDAPVLVGELAERACTGAVISGVKPWIFIRHSSL